MEIPPERVFREQKISKCRAQFGAILRNLTQRTLTADSSPLQVPRRRKPCVVATQMLESMINNLGHAR